MTLVRNLLIATYAESAAGILYSLSITWLVYLITHSPWALGLSLGVYLVPKTFGAMVVGHVMDNKFRRVYIMGTNIVRALVALVIPIAWVFSIRTFWLILLVTFFEAILGSYIHLAYQVMAKHGVISRDLLRFNALIASGTGIVEVVILIAMSLFLLGQPSNRLLLIVSTLICISAIAVGLIPAESYPQVAVNPESISWRNFRKALDFIKSDSRVTVILISGFGINLALAPILSQLPVLVRMHFHAQSSFYSMLLACMSLGVVVVSLVMAYARVTIRRPKVALNLVLTVELVFAGIIAAAGDVRSRFIELVLFALLGAAQSTINTFEISLLQMIIPHRLVARVLSVIVTVSGTGAVIGLALAAWGMNIVGLVWTFLLFALFALIAVAMSFFWLFQLRRNEEVKLGED
ncbi:MFS transporter [Alicyclobacillus tolerans]|uniref:MFS transporter n=1 Tax=Alicyclobacillus tolerans TaxID=90970 RepID=UPI003B80ADB9